MAAADSRTFLLYRAQDHYLFAGAGAAPIYDYPTAQWFATSLIDRQAFARRWPQAGRLLTLPEGARYESYPPPGAWLPTMPDGSVCDQGVRWMAHTEPSRGTAWGTQHITLDLKRGATEGMVVHELTHLVTAIEVGDDHEEHGVEFAQNMLVLVEWAHGRPAAAQLRDSLRAAGLLEPTTPRTRAAQAAQRDPPRLHRDCDAATPPVEPRQVATPQVEAGFCGHVVWSRVVSWGRDDALRPKTTAPQPLSRRPRHPITNGAQR